MTYISREALKKRFCGHCNDYHDGRCFEPCYELKLIDNTPAADVVPVVKCYDCKYYKSGRDGVAQCTRFWIYTAEDDFCSSGAKMDGGADNG